MTERSSSSSNPRPRPTSSAASSSAARLSERKGINLPNTPLPIPSMTEKDHADLIWAMEQNVDYIALSFVRTAEDCRRSRT